MIALSLPRLESDCEYTIASEWQTSHSRVLFVLDKYTVHIVAWNQIIQMSFVLPVSNICSSKLSYKETFYFWFSSNLLYQINFVLSKIIVLVSHFSTTVFNCECNSLQQMAFEYMLHIRVRSIIQYIEHIE